ncbi:MAG: peptide deformylase [Peptostreptococcaceae bacterium]|nr:peptide deformylase [Peptostreptococcaceae bacterium]
MATRQIRKVGDDVLRKKSKIVEKIDQKILTLLDDMYETMKEADGVGLAAPQIGILKRIAVIDVGEGLVEIINPQIIERKGEQVGDEGCLSVPNEYGPVKRPNYVKVKALNRNGEEVIIEGEEFFARALCHEIDHLDGVLFTDKLEEEIID